MESKSTELTSVSSTNKIQNQISQKEFHNTNSIVGDIEKK